MRRYIEAMEDLMNSVQVLLENMADLGEDVQEETGEIREDVSQVITDLGKARAVSQQ